jgi:uncharacterized Zn finger protein
MPWDYFEPSRPREAKGGIKAQSRRGTFGESWWAKRWMRVLEGFDLGARLTRGRSYARSGQVLSIAVGEGEVRAKVQGSRPRPYDVTLRVTPLSPAEWQQVTDALAGQALFAARLLAGQMPDDIETVFTGVGVPLFPTRAGDLQADCSCPDWSNPCKHSAAVYCLLGEEFDRDPFVLFTLRGLSREDLLTRLAAGTPGPASSQTSDSSDADAPLQAPEPLCADPSAFWQGPTLPEDLFGEVRRPPVSAALPRRLGNFPFWRGEKPFLDALEPLYARASRQGLNAFLGSAMAAEDQETAASE